MFFVSIFIFEKSVLKTVNKYLVNYSQLMKYHIHRKRKIVECDGGCAPTPCPPSPIDVECSGGMGPVRIGGPDKFDNVFGMSTKKKVKVKRRSRNG